MRAWVWGSPLVVLGVFVACSSDEGASAGAGADASVSEAGEGDGGVREDASTVAPDGSVVPTTACKAAGGGAAVAAPTFVRNIAPGETGWFGSPAIVDLDGNGSKEIVLTLYSTFVYDAAGKQLAKGTATQGRIYAPGVVADIDGDGTTDIVVGGNGGTVAAYEWKAGKLSVKTGWPASTSSGGQDPEARGLAAGDLDRDGKLEIVVTTTNTSSTGSQVFVFSANGQVYQPAGAAVKAWPRYNTATGTGNDADFNGVGNHGYGCYGLNVGLGNIDDDPELEILVTYDNHQINAFNHDGTSILASDWYTNPATDNLGKRMGWGQFIRWRELTDEDGLYHLHKDPWPKVATNMWLQMTASPPNVVDVDGDGKNDVVVIPNAEMKEPYETQGYAFMVLQGAQGGGVRSARRLPAFETLPFSSKPAVRASDDYFPPDGVPAPTTVNILGDARPEIVAPINDGFVYAITPDGAVAWKFDYAKGAPKTFASEVTVADLNKDGTPELLFGTYSLAANGGRLIVLANTGALLFDVPLPKQGSNGNGIGVPAAPTVGDLDGNGTLEVFLQTFDHGVDVFTFPGSGESCLLWPNARGNLLRDGTSASTVK